jgi:hypothetical protein
MVEYATRSPDSWCASADTANSTSVAASRAGHAARTEFVERAQPLARREEILLGTLAVRDVEQAHDDEPAPVRRGHGALLLHDPAIVAGQRPVTLLAARLAHRREYIVVLALVPPRLVRQEQFGVGATEQFLGRTAVESPRRRVHQHVSMVLVLRDDRHGDGAQHRVEQRLARLERLLRALQFGHVQRDADDERLAILEHDRSLGLEQPAPLPRPAG